MQLGKVNQNVSNIKIRPDSQGQKCHFCAKVNMGGEGIPVWIFFFFLNVFWFSNDVKNSLG